MSNETITLKTLEDFETQVKLLIEGEKRTIERFQKKRDDLVMGDSARVPIQYAINSRNLSLDTLTKARTIIRAQNHEIKRLTYELKQLK